MLASLYRMRNLDGRQQATARYIALHSGQEFRLLRGETEKTRAGGKIIQGL